MRQYSTAKHSNERPATVFDTSFLRSSTRWFVFSKVVGKSASYAKIGAAREIRCWPLLRWLRERVAPAVLVAVHSLLQLMIKVARQEQRNEERNGPNNQHSERSQHTDGGENTKLYTNDIHLRHCVGVVGAVILRVEITFVEKKKTSTDAA